MHSSCSPIFVSRQNVMVSFAAACIRNLQVLSFLCVSGSLLTRELSALASDVCMLFQKTFLVFDFESVK